MLYKIKMKSDVFFKINNKLKTNNLEITLDYVIFELDINNYKILKNSNYKYELIDSLYNKTNLLIQKYYLIGIGILFVFSILYIDSYRVDDIVFNNDTPINNEIEEIISSKFRKLTIYEYSTIDYKELSNELRQAYSSYPYINVYKENDIIKVDIYNYNEKVNEEVYYQTNGDIIAKKAAIVDQFYIYNGSLNVYKNKYVNEGDILVRSLIGNDVYVAAKGLILGYTYEKVKITIDKSSTSYEYTNNISNYHHISFFSLGFDLGKNNDFKLYDYDEKELFNLFGVFSIKQIVEKEKNVIISSYEYDEAISLANNIINEDFESKKTNDFERIVDSYIYKVSENIDSFDIEIILKKYESIGIFKER